MRPINRLMDILGVAASGLHTALLRLEASAHNVANLHTDDFRPLEIIQTEAAGGGSLARIHQAVSSRPVDLVLEVVQQSRARHQHLASLRLLETELDRRGQLADLLG